jgi:hypothetical protein
VSRESDELRRLAQVERQLAWKHARRLPSCAGDTVSAFSRTHPGWAMGGAAAITMALVARHKKKAGIEGKTSSWPMAVAAVSSRWLPEILSLAGLTTRKITQPKQTPSAEQVRP